ncbi:hypothetical protein DM826_11535 [Halonotius aquaticus]|uniref:Uncharacterized protein n=1 Tax=Halonotius aquaticus TaxID=2216978 RepID=A0A3A6PRZ9_9EURY|nr:hypothetical protein [Halonotius aquaticus]RJX42270.1 hypothetical protein DM826_11535 [Halonotius aquaticus]
MNATTRQTTENWAGTTTNATANTTSLADSLATAERAKNTDPSTTDEDSTIDSLTNRSTTGTSATAERPPGELSIPTRLPEPETTIYRDSATVIRLLQTETMADTAEIRLYRAADANIDEGSTAVATDGGQRRGDLDALPAATRRRFEAAVDAVAEQFDLTVDDDGRLRARRDDHGRAGILEFAATLGDR